MISNRLQFTHVFQRFRGETPCFTMFHGPGGGSRFGNLIETMISLWSAVSGGNDWMNYGELLRLDMARHSSVVSRDLIILNLMCVLYSYDCLCKLLSYLKLYDFL